MKRLFITIGLAIICLRSMAQDDNIRWKALGMLESGNDDGVIGRFGEISRYQILPGIWNKYASGCEGWTNPLIARAVAVRIMNVRVAQYFKEIGCPPSDYDWALLWHCPGRILRRGYGYISPPLSLSDRAYARRFCNLYNEYFRNNL